MSGSKDTNPKQRAGEKKPPLGILSPIAKAHWSHAQFSGLVKYGAWNWRAAGVLASTYLSAIERHADAWNSGEEYDPVDGTHHLGNIMACAAILLDAMAAGKLIDDRPPANADLRRAYDIVMDGMRLLREKYVVGVMTEPRHWTTHDTQEILNAAATAVEGQDGDRRGIRAELAQFSSADLDAELHQRALDRCEYQLPPHQQR